MAEENPQPAPGISSQRAIAIALVAWLVPGMGHMVLRRWGRAVVFFATVGALAVAGYLLRGNTFAAHSDDIFDSLGYLADLGSGIFFFLAKYIERAGPDVSRAAGDYGTRFIATAGVVNLLCVLDAYEIGRGRKN